MQLWEIIWAEISGRAHNVPTGTRWVICGWLTTSEFVGEDTIFPVVFPTEKQRRCEVPTMQYQTFANEIRLYNGETWYIGNIGALVGVWRFCPEICYGGGRLSAARLFFPWKNNVGAKRRQCNIKHLQIKFGCTMAKHGIFATSVLGMAKSVLPRNLPRWRADNIRPYVWCVQPRRAGATEFPGGNFGVFVGMVRAAFAGVCCKRKKAGIAPGFSLLNIQ